MNLIVAKRPKNQKSKKPNPTKPTNPSLKKPTTTTKKPRGKFCTQKGFDTVFAKL